MALALKHGLHSAPWAEPGPGAHVERAAAYLLYSEVENGRVVQSGWQGRMCMI
jgi:putative acyl-CoA dehydrogenase